MKTLKAALKKSSKPDSSFWNRMEQTVKKSSFGDLPKSRQDRVLDFFTPEWEARDGRFFPRLDDFLENCWQLQDLNSASEVLYSEHLQGDKLAVNKIANTLGYSFNSAMGLMLTLASLDLVKRVPPYTKSTLTPIYHVTINRPAAMFKLAALAGFDQPKTDFLFDLFKPELEGDNAAMAIDLVRVAAQTAHQLVLHHIVKEHLAANPNKSFSAADILKIMSTPGSAMFSSWTSSTASYKYRFDNAPTVAEAERLLLEIAYEDRNLKRALPFLQSEEGHGFIRFVYKPQHVEVASLTPDEAKAFFSNLQYTEGSRTSQPASFLTDEVKSFIQRTVQEAVETALVHPDRVHMEGIRSLLRERKLSTNDPVAVIKAKLSKKRTPRA